MNRRFSRCGIVLGIAFVVATTSGGCRGIVGIEDGPPTKIAATPPSPSACNATAKTEAACAACLTGRCCTPLESCAALGGCADFVGCIQPCAGDAICAETCRRRFPTAYVGDVGSAIASVESCTASRCEGECRVGCGGYVHADAKCAGCMARTPLCCENGRTCMKNTECAALVACERTCAPHDDQCLLDCELAHPEGVAAQRALGSCLQDNCADSCIEPRWACLPPPPPPPGTLATLRVTYRFVDYPFNFRVQNLRVRLCRKAFGATCSEIAHKDTNAAGEVWFDVTGPTFDEYAEVTGAGYARTVVYLPRISSDFVAFLGVVQNDVFPDLAKEKVGVVLDETKGNLLVNVVDCFGDPADGVQFELGSPNEGARAYYFQGGEPNKDAKATDKAPSTGAYAAFLNLESGSVSVDAHVAKNQLPYGRATVHTVAGIKEHALTVLVLYASPP